MTSEPSKSKSLYGLIAEFDDTPVFFEAAEKCRDQGFRQWDCLTPFPVHGLDDAMGLPRSKVPFFTFCGGFTGFCTGMLITYLMNMYDYPLIVGGKPYWSPIYPFPIMYELTILLSAFGTLGGMFLMNLLPRHNHPVFEYENFIQSGEDKLMIFIGKADPFFDPVKTRSFLESLGATRVSPIEA